MRCLTVDAFFALGIGNTLLSHQQSWLRVCQCSDIDCLPFAGGWQQRCRSSQGSFQRLPRQVGRRRGDGRLLQRCCQTQDSSKALQQNCQLPTIPHAANEQVSQLVYQRPYSTTRKISQNLTTLHVCCLRKRWYHSACVSCLTNGLPQDGGLELVMGSAVNDYSCSIWYS